ncbi:MAG: energy transducer TonB [Croceimicrobium sp.]
MACSLFQKGWPSKFFIEANNYQAVISDEQLQNYKEIMDESPLYPNGVQGILQHISNNYQYPAQAKADGIQGRVYLSFTINKEGWVEAAKVQHSDHPVFNDEALRVIHSLDRWIPAKLQGKFVAVPYTVPIKLKLE